MRKDNKRSPEGVTQTPHGGTRTPGPLIWFPRVDRVSAEDVVGGRVPHTATWFSRLRLPAPPRTVQSDVITGTDDAFMDANIGSDMTKPVQKERKALFCLK